MKKIIPLLLLMLHCNAEAAIPRLSSGSSSLTWVKNPGMVYSLAAYKVSAEGMLEYYLSDPKRIDVAQADAALAVDRVRASYDQLRAEVDGLLLHLIVTMKSKNSVKPYREGEKAMSGNGGDIRVLEAMLRIEKAYKGFADLCGSIPRTDIALPSTDGVQELAFADLPISPTDLIDVIVKAAEVRKGKVEDVTAVLNGLRFRALSEIATATKN